jgi:hypothetical protein
VKVDGIEAVNAPTSKAYLTNNDRIKKRLGVSESGSLTVMMKVSWFLVLGDDRTEVGAEEIEVHLAILVTHPRETIETVPNSNYPVNFQNFESEA